MTQIYGLYDPTEPGTPRIRYVGYTGFSLERRLIQHVSEATRGKQSHRCNWIRSLLECDVRPAIMQIEIVTSENWQERERFWISKLRFDLTNTTDGGEGLINPSQDVRDRISAKVSEGLKGNTRRTGKAHSEEHRAKISEGLRNSESRKTYTDSLKGKPLIAATEAARLVNTGRALSPERVEQIRKRALGNTYGLGRKFSDEHKAKLREANLGNKYGLGHKKSDEARAAIATARRSGKWITNGVESRFIHDGVVPEGWRFGMAPKRRSSCP